MLLVHCPYCGEDRPEIEFAYAGEAHIARPDAKEQGEMSDADWSKFMFIRENTRGEHCERWWHANGCNGMSARATMPASRTRCGLQTKPIAFISVPCTPRPVSFWAAPIFSLLENRIADHTDKRGLSAPGATRLPRGYFGQDEKEM